MIKFMENKNLNYNIIILFFFLEINLIILSKFKKNYNILKLWVLYKKYLLYAIKYILYKIIIY